MYKVGIIGLGHIVRGDAQKHPDPYCHAAGVSQSEKVELAGVAELSAETQQTFKDAWGKRLPDVTYYKAAKDMLAAESPDIVSICVRGPQHFAVAMDVIESRPKAIFLEKPPSCSLAEMDQMLAAADTNGIPITVSYSRHFSPKVMWMEKLIKDGLIGDLQAVIGYCGCGVLSSCSHVTDQICQFVGYDPQAVFARGRIFDDAPEGYKPEPRLDSMTIEFPHGVHGHHIGVDVGAEGAFYCDLIGSEGYARAGIYIEPMAVRHGEGPVDLSSRGMPTEESAFKVAYDQIADHLDGGDYPSCTGQNFVTVNEVGFAAIESILTDRRVLLGEVDRDLKVFANG